MRGVISLFVLPQKEWWTAVAKYLYLGEYFMKYTGCCFMKCLYEIKRYSAPVFTLRVPVISSLPSCPLSCSLARRKVWYFKESQLLADSRKCFYSWTVLIYFCRNTSIIINLKNKNYRSDPNRHCLNIRKWKAKNGDIFLLCCSKGLKLGIAIS